MKYQSKDEVKNNVLSHVKSASGNFIASTIGMQCEHIIRYSMLTDDDLMSVINWFNDKYKGVFSEYGK